MARKERKYHYIYKITCLKNERYYIGMHSTDNLEDGYMGGGKRIKNSVKKHGKDAHRKEILEFFESREDLKNREMQLVNEELINDSMCMNIQLGGGGGFINEDHQIKCSRAGGIANSNMMKIDENHKDKFIKLANDNRNKAINNGNFKIPSWIGKKHSEETKEKIGKMNSELQAGEKNSQFGKIWISNDELGINKKIDKSEIESYFKIGYKRGLVMKYFQSNK
jgi:hypothetical protein